MRKLAAHPWNSQVPCQLFTLDSTSVAVSVGGRRIDFVSIDLPASKFRDEHRSIYSALPSEGRKAGAAVFRGGVNNTQGWTSPRNRCEKWATRGYLISRLRSYQGAAAFIRSLISESYLVHYFNKFRIVAQGVEAGIGF